MTGQNRSISLVRTPGMGVGDAAPQGRDAKSGPRRYRGGFALALGASVLATSVGGCSSLLNPIREQAPYVDIGWEEMQDNNELNKRAIADLLLFNDTPPFIVADQIIIHESAIRAAVDGDYRDDGKATVIGRVDRTVLIERPVGIEDPNEGLVVFIRIGTESDGDTRYGVVFAGKLMEETPNLIEVSGLRDPADPGNAILFTDEEFGFIGADGSSANVATMVER